jgi:hypothetical protein
MAKSTVTPNAQSAVTYLQGKGWTQAQAQGIVGNFQVESGVNLNPSAVGDGGAAYGIAQWHPDRQAAFQQQYGFPIQQATTQQQLDFVNYELTQGKEVAAGNRIRATTTAGEAAAVTDQYYERSNGLARGQRIANANALAGAGAGNPNATPAPGTPPPTAPGANTPTTEPPPGAVSDPYNTDFYTIPGGAQTPKTGVNANPDVIDITKPLNNILHEFPSYTYGLSLHLLTAQEYNGLVTGSITNYVPARVLVASAGRYTSQTGGVIPGSQGGVFNRSPYFADDFYFDDFTVTTVIGTNANSRNTNAIEFSFTLLEPYGMTLINRLLDQANDPEMACDNYLDMVYLLQIDFFASNDAGEILGVIPGNTKRFPVKITQMNIKAGVRGSEYQIQAVPYNHSAFDQTTISTPANFEVTAGSISDMFQSGAGSSNSFANALNGWQNDLVKNNKIGVPDTYAFNFDSAIASSPFTSSQNLSPRDTSMVDPANTNSIRQSNLGGASTDYNSQARTFSINAGTSIDKVIDYAMRNSDYIQNQIAVPDGSDPQLYLQQKDKLATQALNWYKITPTVTLGAFDPLRKIYARNITYNVSSYPIYNVKSDVAPQGKASVFVKEYNYIYTGQNVDVIDFDINFNTLYYTAQTAYRSAMSSIYKSPTPTTPSNNNQNSDTYQGVVQQANNVMPMVMKPQVYNAKARATGGAVSAKDVAVADLEDSLMTLSAADMLNVQLKILGDPQFIKQDDCFFNPMVAGAVSAADPRLTSNGSIRTDYAEIYVNLTFRTPTDINEGTGLMEFGTNFKTSVFSGLYRVLTVQSEFKGGQFTQTLNLVRLPNQVNYDYVSKPYTSSGQRSSDITPASSVSLNNNNNVMNIGVPKTSLPSLTDITPALSRAQNELQNLTPGLTTLQQQLRNVNLTSTIKAVTESTAPVKIPPLI